jgi:MoxR-like ATPase
VSSSAPLSDTLPPIAGTPDQQIAAVQKRMAAVRGEIGRIIVGNTEVVTRVLTAIAAGGHVLLEGLPGLGKTLLVRSLSQSLDLVYRRIQFTPDLMPADVTGTTVIVEEQGGGRQFRFQQGPIFGNLILCDEVNRATPKTQSALLEAMQERQVTIAGATHALPNPFFVLATQNPIELEGTYPLPEAQLDRFFFKLDVTAGSVAELATILARTTGSEAQEASQVLAGSEILTIQKIVRRVPVAEDVVQYAARLVANTHPTGPQAPREVRSFVRFGSSPRGGQALLLAARATAVMAGRLHPSFADVRDAALPALAHRVIRNFEGESEGIAQSEIVSAVIALTPETT